MSMSADLIRDMTNWRRTIHACPEMAFEEVSTARLVASVLRENGIEVHEGIGRTGVVGTLRRGKGPSIGLRADMDALPIAEKNTFAYRSAHEGKMHACGHDGHTAMLLGAAIALARDDSWRGTAHFIFQPAEEGAGGGRVMVEEGLFERFPCEAVYGMHNYPGLPLGRFGVMPGPVMASLDNFEIVVQGKGAHAAMPEMGIDALTCASHIVLAIQTIVSRRLSPQEAAVVSVTQVHGGEAWNALPDAAVIRGTVRCFSMELQRRIAAMLTEISEMTARAMGATAAVSYQYHYPPVINSAAETEVAARAACAVVGDERVEGGHKPCMASDDFAFMLNAKPGAYIWLGVDEDRPTVPVHNPHYDFNDNALAFGASYWVELVRTVCKAAD